MATHVTNPTGSAPNAEPDDGSRPQSEQASEEKRVSEAESLTAKSTYEVIRREAWPSWGTASASSS